MEQWYFRIATNTASSNHLECEAPSIIIAPNMIHSPQDVYARHLVSGRGYPLWTPEPSMSLPDIYRQEGLKIGDVGVVVPEDGSFDVFLNVCLSPEHSLHRETGVPNNFTPISLSRRDIVVYPEAEAAGRVISTTSMTRVRNTDASSGENPESRPKPGPLNYEFTLSSEEGAILILPEGAERYYLRNERPFLDEAVKHAVDWYNFAEQRLGRIISHDSLYLITGFYKARSWSLAAYQQGAGASEALAQFKAIQVGGGNIATSYTWEATQATDWRVGPSDQYYNGIPNQAVFIQGFKIAVRDGILGSKWVKVKADFPSVRPYRVEFSSGSWFSGLWGGSSASSSGSTANTLGGTGTNFNMDTTESNPPDEGDNVREDVVIHRLPQVTKPFHPSDIINQYLLRENPSATVSITHDSQWATLLARGLLVPEELSQADRLVESVTKNYSAVLLPAGAVYLKSKALRLSGEHREHSSTSTPQLLDDLSVTDDFSATPYNDYYDPVARLDIPAWHTVSGGADASFSSPQKSTPSFGTSNLSRVSLSPLGNAFSKRVPCIQCRARKIRCDGARPSCASCVRRSFSCIYKLDTKEMSKGPIPPTIRRLGEFEELPQESTNNYSRASALKDAAYLQNPANIIDDGISPNVMPSDGHPQRPSIPPAAVPAQSGATAPVFADKKAVGYLTALHNHLQERNETHLLGWKESYEGPPNALVWTAVCKVGDQVLGSGTASQLRQAKEQAAQSACQALGISA